MLWRDGGCQPSPGSRGQVGQAPEGGTGAQALLSVYDQRHSQHASTDTKQRMWPREGSQGELLKVWGSGRAQAHWRPEDRHQDSGCVTEDPTRTHAVTAWGHVVGLAVSRSRSRDSAVTSGFRVGTHVFWE